MATTYFTLLTKIGQAKIANAIALGNTVAWTHMAVGDGNGNPTTPSENQTALVRENYRNLINQLTVDAENPNYMVAELVVPTTVGGWTVYEVGIFDADGDMIAVANFPATYKPQLEEGSGRDLVVRIIIQVSNASIVTLKVDPAIVLASQKWVADQYVKKVTVAGGTTGQVLAKSSNANEAFHWVDPTAAVSVLVDAKPERQTLADLQTVVNLSVLTTTALAVYIEGARLIETIDYTVNSETQFTLARAYPAGSRIHMYQNDPTSLIADATVSERGFIQLATTAEAQALLNDAHALTPKKLAEVLAYLGISPAGTVAPFAGTVAKIPQGWLLCDASTVSRTTYAKLFDAIGTTYGAGNGTTTFGLPDMRGEFIRGLDNGRGVDAGRTLGSNQKGSAHTLDFKVAAVFGDGADSLTSADTLEILGYDPLVASNYTNGRWSAVAPDGSGVIGGSGDEAVTGQTRPRNVAMNYIIKY